MNFSQIIVQWIIGMLARLVAYQIDKKSINTYFNRIHTGASARWAASLRDDCWQPHEVAGRHARRATFSLAG